MVRKRGSEIQIPVAPKEEAHDAYKPGGVHNYLPIRRSTDTAEMNVMSRFGTVCEGRGLWLL
jgi:hypothetical protein